MSVGIIKADSLLFFVKTTTATETVDIEDNIASISPSSIRNPPTLT